MGKITNRNAKNVWILIPRPGQGKEAGARSRQQETKRNLMLLACAYSANIGGTGVITGWWSHGHCRLYAVKATSE